MKQQTILLRRSQLVALCFLAGASFFSACRRASDDDSPQAVPTPLPSPKAEDPGLSLTIPQAKWANSNFCGQTTPAIPTDPTPEYRFDNTLLNEKLSGQGLKGWIHGAVPVYDQYVFTYRKEDPNDFMAFFKAQQFSLVPTDTEVAKTLATLKRHDQIVLKGQVFENGSPLVHIKVSAIEVVKKYPLATDNSYQLDLSKFKGVTTFDVFGIVHAIAHSDRLGYAVMVENKDLILPVIIDPAHANQAAALFRGDIVNMSVKLVQHAAGPPHFASDATKSSVLTVIDPMINCHGVDKTVTGTLVKFDKSPAISTDVYAVRYIDANGIGRNFTFFPASEDEETFMQVFTAISAKAKDAWDKSSEEAKVVRNFHEKGKVRVVAKGKLNVVSTEQANAQVYIDSADDVSFEIVP